MVDLEELRDVVGWTLPEAERLLGPVGLVVEERPAAFARVVTEVRGSPYLLQSGGWVDRHESLNAKWVRLQSRKVDLALLMIYPTARPDLVPVFMAEWVVVGDVVQVAVLDVQPLGDPTLQAALAPTYAPLGDRYRPQLPAKEDAPEWFAQQAQPWLLFSKCPVDQVDLLASAFREYLGAAVAGWYLPRQAEAGGPCRCGPVVSHDASAGEFAGSRERTGPQCSRVDAYKRRLFEHSEGRKILRVTYGEAFTEAFLGWHFGPPNAPLVVESPFEPEAVCA